MLELPTNIGTTGFRWVADQSDDESDPTLKKEKPEPRPRITTQFRLVKFTLYFLSGRIRIRNPVCRTHDHGTQKNFKKN